MASKSVSGIRKVIPLDPRTNQFESQTSPPILTAFEKSFAQHLARPTVSGLNLFIGNIDLALAVCKHLEDELRAMRDRAVLLLAQIAREDAAVAEFNQRIPAKGGAA